MTVKEAIDYINAHTWSQWKLGLSRTEELLRLLGNPQKELRFVHVAGSNGKGSTCAMVERILREAGYVTGFYPSPYIEDFRERIQVCGEYITEDALCRITLRVRDLADSMEDHPTQFELITAIGMVYFAEKKCDLVVLEVGLGGIFDSTNVIDAPEAAVITNIGLEHTEYLGNTLAEIAGNKCGIIKSGADVVCYDNVPEVMEVVRRVCAEKGCPLHVVHYDRIHPVEKSLEGQSFIFASSSSLQPLGLSLLGEYQLHNAATALTVVEALRGRGWDIPEKAVLQGLANVQWPARFEVLSRKPLFILDGGHNPQCAGALAESLRDYLPAAGSGKAGQPGAWKEHDHNEEADKKAVFLMGMLADKDYRAVIEIIAPFAAGFVCLTPDSPRALPAEELAAELQNRGFYAKACGTAAEGIAEALSLAAGGITKLQEACMAGVPGGTSRPNKTCPAGVPGGAAQSNKTCPAGVPGDIAQPKELRPEEMPGGAVQPEESPMMLPVVSFGSLYMAGAVRSAFPAALRQYLVSMKKKQRNKAIKGRRGLNPEERAVKSAAICSTLEAMLELEQAETVMTYAATWDEADPGEVSRMLEAQGKTVCYPLTGENWSMEAVIPGGKGRPSSDSSDTSDTSDSSDQADSVCPSVSVDISEPVYPAYPTDPEDPVIWKTGVFGIREPVKEYALPVDPSKIDAVIVPCVVFDRQGGRCGHGAGYYDRFLAKISPSVPKILIAFDAQEAEAVAMEETDLPMDFVITESGLTDVTGGLTDHGRKY